MNKKVITFGEIMLRLSTPGHARFVQTSQFLAHYGGSEANVASSLSLFGIASAHVTCFPDNDFGRAAVQSLKFCGVDTGYIAFREGRMGVYFLENGTMQRASRIVYDRVDSAFAQLDPAVFDWDQIMKEASWFHWSGITPAVSKTAADACLRAVQAAKKHGVTVSADINYRRNLWQYGKTPLQIMPELISNSDIIIGGTNDFENCVSISGNNFETTSRKVMESYRNIKKIANTKRDIVSASHNRISSVLWNGTTLERSKDYDLTHIVDRVGGGDAFMAGLIYGFLKNRTDLEALEFATAASALKHGIEGDTNFITVKEIESLVQGENVGKLLR